MLAAIHATVGGLLLCFQFQLAHRFHVAGLGVLRLDTEFLLVELLHHHVELLVLHLQLLHLLGQLLHLLRKLALLGLRVGEEVGHRLSREVEHLAQHRVLVLGAINRVQVGRHLHTLDQ